MKGSMRKTLCGVVALAFAGTSAIGQCGAQYRALPRVKSIGSEEVLVLMHSGIAEQLAHAASVDPEADQEYWLIGESFHPSSDGPHVVRLEGIKSYPDRQPKNAVGRLRYNSNGNCSTTAQDLQSNFAVDITLCRGGQDNIPGYGGTFARVDEHPLESKEPAVAEIDPREKAIGIYEVMEACNIPQVQIDPNLQSLEKIRAHLLENPPSEKFAAYRTVPVSKQGNEFIDAPTVFGLSEGWLRAFSPSHDEGNLDSYIIPQR